MKILDGKELAGFIKERQAHVVRGMAKKPTLLGCKMQEKTPASLKYRPEGAVRVISSVFDYCRVEFGSITINV